MPLLPARIPEIPEERAEIVPARLARKVGPLFGVAWEDGPFGRRTWVSDHSRITLSEIARGAPQPTRTQSARLDAVTAQRAEPGTDPRTPEDDGPPWRIVDRIGLSNRRGDLPNEIANATLNRFGPDTRSAVLLTAVNRLLDPVRQAVDQALALLRDAAGGPLDVELRIAAWASLVVETFRSQPALVAAGIGARAIQRELVAAWDLPRSPLLSGTSFTRCEISSEDRPRSPSQPCDLDVVDTTFARLGVDDPSEAALARRLRHDGIVDRLLRRLRAAGTLQDASHLWLSRRGPDEVVVEALVPSTQLVRDFVVQVAPNGSAPVAPPAPPSPEQVRELTPVGRRAVLLALLGVLRYVQDDPERREHDRPGTVDVAGRIAGLADAVLDPDDPARPLVRCRCFLIVVETLRHDTAHDLAAPLELLRGAADECIAAYRSGLVDRGALAEILGAANVEINAIRRTNAAGPSSGLPGPDVLDTWLRASWAEYLEALEVDPERVEQHPGIEMLGYHLHNYAAFLASHPDSPDDLAAAVHLYRQVVIPARDRFLARDGMFDPLRRALAMASRATTSQAEAAVAAGRPDDGRLRVAEGMDWVRRVLDEPSTPALLAGTTEAAYRLALMIAPTLLLAAELDAPGAAPDDPRVVAGLVETARRWERSTPAGATGTHVRRTDVDGLEQRLARLGRTPHPRHPGSAGHVA